MSFIKIEIDKEELKAALDLVDDVSKVLRTKPIMERALKTALKPMLDQAREDAPEGPTGNLVKSIGAKSARVRNPRTTFAAIQFGIFAPHSYFVQDGTGPRTRKSDGRYVGIMPPNLFFKISYEQHKEEFVRSVAKTIVSEIEKTVDRKIKRIRKGS